MSVLSEHRPPRSMPVCVCGRAATLQRGNAFLCRECAVNRGKPTVDPAKETKPAEPTPEELRLQEACREAFDICAMKEGFSKPRKAWQTKYADLIADEPQPTVKPILSEAGQDGESSQGVSSAPGPTDDSPAEDALTD